MVGLHLAVLIIFSEAAPANGVDTPFYIFTVVSLSSAEKGMYKNSDDFEKELLVEFGA